MLELGDLDFYYLIICSRGPGSETITVTKLDETETEIELLETSEDEFNKFGVCEATTNFNDEGPVIAVPFGTMPLEAIYEWLKYDYARNEQHLEPLNIPGMSDETRAMVEGIEATRLATRQAYISACIRVFLSSDIGMGNNPWTSVNGWRQSILNFPTRLSLRLSWKRQVRRRNNSGNGTVRFSKKQRSATWKELCRRKSFEAADFNLKGAAIRSRLFHHSIGVFKMPRVIGYLRVSTSDQDLKNCRNQILNFANERRLGPVDWIEETISGTIPWQQRALG